MAKTASVETLDRYLDRLASADPTPGGGSAAALVGASGAALVEMVARICAANPKYAEFRDLSTRTASAAASLRADLLTARDRDERAFERVVAAQGQPHDTPAEKAARAGAIEAALAGAAETPLHSCELAIDVMRLAVQLLQIPNKHLASDLGCAGEFGFAALVACGYNVRVNHRYMSDAATIDKQAKLLNRYETEAMAILQHLRRAIAETLARPKK